MNFLTLIKKIFIPCKENNFLPLFLKKKFLNFYLILILILKIFTLPLILSISKMAFFADITKTTLFELLNAERKTKNLHPLVINPKLELSAYLKAKDILEKNYFSHWSPDGKSPWYWFKVTGYDYLSAGENLAIGFLDSKEVHQAWMASFSHQQNILNFNYKEVGIAVLKGNFNGNEVYVVVQHFGNPKEKTLIQNEDKTIPSPLQISEIITSTETGITSTQPATSTEIASLESATQTKKNQEATTALFIGEEKIFPQPLSFKIAKFLNKNYTLILNGIIYATLIILIFSLTLTIYFDIFVYRKYIIDYKELIPRWVSFFLLFLIFLYLDQSKIIQLIPHQLLIYGK